MADFTRVLALSIVLSIPGGASAALWEFAGFMDGDQALTSTVPDPYVGGGFVSALLNSDTGVFEWFI